MYIRGYQPESDGFIPKLERGEIRLPEHATVNTVWCSEEAANKVWAIASNLGVKTLSIKTPTDRYDYANNN
jgi:hypothetical protein